MTKYITKYITNYLVILLLSLLTACGGGSPTSPVNPVDISTPVTPINQVTPVNTPTPVNPVNTPTPINPVNNTLCINTNWLPNTNIMQNGVRFTQESNCGNTRINIGTMAIEAVEPTSTINFAATQSIYLNLLKTQITPTFTTFVLKTMPSNGSLTVSTNALTYLSHKYGITDTFSIDTTGSDNADIWVNIRMTSGDPLFQEQWYIVNQRNDIMGDINAQKTLAKSYSGKGVNIAVVDSFANNNHEDINFVEKYNPNSSAADSHGTAVAGIIAGAGYNNKGIRGVAYNSILHNYNRNIAGTNHWEKVTGSSTFNPNSAQVDIFNFSFGAPAQGATVEHGRILSYGTTNRRDGKGAIYVAAAGNNGSNEAVQLNNTNWGVYPLYVSALNPFTNQKASYSSGGTGLWLTTYSSDLTTTGVGNSDYVSFGGTSGAAPIVSGAIALMLEANNNLTWRDVRYILATTARKIDANIAPAIQTIGGVAYESRQAWTTNSAGHDFHEWYGFGGLDVDAAVNMAENYVTNSYSVLYNANYIDLTNSNAWHASETLSPGITITPLDGNGISRTLMVNENISIESVEVFFDTIYDTTSALGIKLTSPAGTTAIVAPLGNNAGNTQASINAFFEESSAGNWTIEFVTDHLSANDNLSGWGIRFFGVTN